MQKARWAGLNLLLFIPLFLVHAEEPTIFDLKKAVALSDSETVYRDYYINGGTEAGVRAGMVIPVVRKVTLYDTFQNRSPGDMLVPVARIKIIYSQKGIAVGRFHSDFDWGSQPRLDDHYIMVGDRLDVQNAKVERTRSTASVSSRAMHDSNGVETYPGMEIKPAEIPQEESKQ